MDVKGTHVVNAASEGISTVNVRFKRGVPYVTSRIKT